MSYHTLRKKVDVMMTDCEKAKQMLNAVWNDDINLLEKALKNGASPNWIINGYPILIHAVYMRNINMITLLIEYGAIQVEEALGFALDRCIGEVIMPLMYMGIVPKMKEPKAIFGPYPSRYCPLDYNPKLRV